MTSDQPERPRSICVRMWRIGIMAVLSAFIIATPVTPVVASSRTSDPAAIANTYTSVTTWLASWETPDAAPLPAGTSGVWVGIRRAGRLVGEGKDDRSIIDPIGSPQTLPRAVRLALANAEERVRAIAGDPLEAEQLAQQLRDAPTTVEIQFARDVKRVRVTSAASLLSRLDPGLHGMVLRYQRNVAAMFPVEMVVNGQTPRQALDWLSAQLGIGEDQMNEGLADGSIRAWRFEVDHLAQRERGYPPMFLYRGSRVVQASAANQAGLATFEHDLVKHLMQRAWPRVEEPLGLTGTYLPDMDTYRPVLASPEDQALTAFALTRYSRSQRDQELCARARALAIRILNDLAVREPEEPDPTGRTGAAAMIVVAARELKNAGVTNLDIVDLMDRAMSRLEMAFDPDNGFADDLGPAERALVAYALLTEPALDAAWRSTAINVHPALLPWIGWAEVEFADARNADELRSAPGLRQLRKRLWDSQVTFTHRDRNPSPDLLGGLAFRGDRPPDWQTARPLAFLATMIAEPRLTESDDVPGEIVKVSNAIRFLLQLSIRPDDAYRIPSHARAMGGLRASVFTTTMPPASSAMALLAVTESLDALAHLSVR